MSASREKKNRQEVAASGVVDPKTARQAQEQAKERRSNRLYAIIAIAFVVVAIGLVVWNSNIIQRGTTAVTVEGESYSAAEVSYYYHNAYNSIVNSKYASLYGIDKNTSLSQQSLNDTAKMMLGVTEDMTWDAYFRDAAKKSLIQLTMLKKGAAEKGLTFDDDMQKEIDSTLETFSTYAKKAGYSTSAYLKLMYGNNMTMSTFKSILKDTVLASHYQQDYIDSLTYTDEEQLRRGRLRVHLLQGYCRLHQGCRRQHRAAHRRGERRRQGGCLRQCQRRSGSRPQRSADGEGRRQLR